MSVNANAKKNKSGPNSLEEFLEKYNVDLKVYLEWTDIVSAAFPSRRKGFKKLSGGIPPKEVSTISYLKNSKKYKLKHLFKHTLVWSEIHKNDINWPILAKKFKKLCKRYNIKKIYIYKLGYLIATEGCEIIGSDGSKQEFISELI
jgi:hypothetical protein